MFPKRQLRRLHFSILGQSIMTTPDSIKYAHTPSATDNVWGVGLKDAKRQSKCTARLDVAQSVTGLILGIFLSATWALLAP